MKLWFPLSINCLVVRDEEDGEYIARIPDVEDIEGYGDSASKAVKDLSEKVFFELRMI